MADIESKFSLWSTTESSNKPTGAASIGTGLAPNLRQIQATTRQYLASVGATIAAASSIDLSTATGHTIPLSGSSTVTGLGTESAGIEYVLQFTSTPTFKNSSALSLPGAADITFAAGDVASFESKGGGDWFCKFLTKANGQAVVVNSSIVGPMSVSGALSVGGTLTASSLVSLASGQIKFPGSAMPSADVNTLDDYEEGTWTPSVGGTATYSIQTGHYLKIGRLVFIRCQLAVASIGTGSVSAISGLPFTSDAFNHGLVVSSETLSASVVAVAGVIAASSSSITFQGRTAASTSVSSVNPFGNSTSVTVTGCYLAAA